MFNYERSYKMNLTSLKFTNRDLLLIIDVQNDFVSGVLGTKRAQALIPDIAQFIRDFPGKKIFTMDTHQENYQIGRAHV